MKKLIILATVAMASFGSADSFAGGCRITPGHVDTYPVLPPPPVCVYPPPRHECVTPPPVCVFPPPRQECRIKPCHVTPPPVCVVPPPPKCQIRVCTPPPPVCVHPPVEPPCHKCGCEVCRCHPEPPVCRIKPCEPVYTVCRIKPCAHTDPGYVDPVPSPVDLPEVQPGQQVTIDGAQFGHQPGTVTVQIGQLALAAQVISWSNTEVRAVLPALPLSSGTQALVVITGAEGQVADQMNVVMLPAAQQVASR